VTLVATARAQPSPASGALGHTRLHLRRTHSTNERARTLAIAGAPHGTLVTAAKQTAGRGRQGRSWTAPAGSALLCSLVLRDPPPLLSLIAGVAVCDAVGKEARVKWPNDIVVEMAAGGPQPTATPTAPLGSESSPSRMTNVPALAKLAGILIEGRPQGGWAVLGIGLNVAVRIEQLPADVRRRAASLELPSSAIEPIMDRLLEALERRLAEPADSVLDAWRARDALLGRDVSWAQGHGRAEGIDGAGRLIVRLADGATTTLDAGEVHLGRAR
jgi:BirA family transcriptional regulator, biotin operon repressor / biotin---[acetyl-CoA-carboxylase] ligase